MSDVRLKEEHDLAFSTDRIRNFCIVAHVDHGKSTLADRLLELTGTIPQSAQNKQVLDKLPVERERGITVKAQTATMVYRHGGTSYLLNLIDTPGHVDFSYEVSRSLAASQGVILLVDANEGVQAQTVANFFLAFEAELAIITVINKIDLKNAAPMQVATQIERLFDIPRSSCIQISAKLGTNIEAVLQAVVENVPPPQGQRDKPLCALLFDSAFEPYRGVVALLALESGQLARGSRIVAAHSGRDYEVLEVGLLRPQEHPQLCLYAGQVGYMVAGMKTAQEAQIGDTIYSYGQPVDPLPGFKPAKPLVFAGMFPIDQSEYVMLRKALEKLMLNDPSVTLIPETSIVLGAGWRLGFLGLLHMDVFYQRLEQEYQASVIRTAPSVTFRARLRSQKLIKEYGKEEISILSPSRFPDRVEVSEYLEPMILATIVTPLEHMKQIMTVCQDCRGTQKEFLNMDDNRVVLKYLLPLSEIISDFYDVLKSLSSGYASFDYEDAGFQGADLVRVDYLLNGNGVEELATVVQREKARHVGKAMCVRLTEVIPRQLFQIAVQAVIHGKVIARETIKPYRKDVLAKCHGGDVTRRMKLLKKQAEGKRSMRRIGNVEVPREAFLRLLRKT
uniref:translation factor GUF1, mitochondrial n=1 Tax=Myxine glutinosa TaxID=7769 RepID=UPI00358F93D5